MSFNSTTPIDFTLQARDWNYLAFIMIRDPIYEDLVFSLKTIMQVQNPPTGQTAVQVTGQYLGVILKLFYECNERYGKEVGKTQRNRFRTALETLANQEVTTFLTEYDATQVAEENVRVETGRKYLRGKLG